MKKILFLLLLLFSLLPHLAEATWVRSYVKKDGTFVSGHYRRSRGFGSSYPSRRYYTPSYTTHYPTYIPTSLSSCMTCGKNSIITTEPEISISQNKAYTNSTNRVDWFDIYKKATILNGDISHISKAEYISKIKQNSIIEQIISKSIPLCKNEQCFLEQITKQSYWENINKKIDDVYIYLNLRKPIYSFLE